MTSTNRHVRAQRKCPWGRPACVVVWGGTVRSRPLPDYEVLSQVLFFLGVKIRGQLFSIFRVAAAHTSSRLGLDVSSRASGSLIV